MYTRTVLQKAFSDRQSLQAPLRPKWQQAVIELRILCRFLRPHEAFLWMPLPGKEQAHDPHYALCVGDQSLGLTKPACSDQWAGFGASRAGFEAWLLGHTISLYLTPGLSFLTCKMGKNNISLLSSTDALRLKGIISRCFINSKVPN